jgi:TolB protein
MKKLLSYQIPIIGVIAIAVIYLMSCGKEDPVSSEETPAAETIVFTSERAGLADGIYAMNPDGSNQRAIWDSTDFQGDPNCSSDGKKIAFVSRYSPTEDYEIYTMNMDGTEIIQITNNEFDDQWPRWSPGDSLIIFAYRLDGIFNIWTMHPNGLNRIQRTFDTANAIDPFWSPDGSKFIFTSRRNSNYYTYIKNLMDVASPTRLTSYTVREIDPQWSNNGEWIALASRDTTANEDDYEIFVMRADGSEMRQITQNTSTDDDPNWSPDDAWIAFRAISDTREDIHKIRADGSGEEINVSNNPGYDALPDWTR